MWDMNDITKVSPVRDHVLWIQFDNGMAGEIDLKEYLEKGPIFEPLSDPEFFRQVRIEGGSLSWPNGADIAPERIYQMIEINQHLGN